MKTSTFTVVRTTRSSDEADNLIQALREAGLHPLDLDPSTYVSVAGTDFSFLVEVPASEAAAARQLLKAFDGPIQERWSAPAPLHHRSTRRRASSL